MKVTIIKITVGLHIAEDFCSKFIELFNEIDTKFSSYDVNNLVSDFSHILTKCADHLFGKNNYYQSH